MSDRESLSNEWEIRRVFKNKLGLFFCSYFRRDAKGAAQSFFIIFLGGENISV